MIFSTLAEKRRRLASITLATLLLGGCATPPQHTQAAAGVEPVLDTGFADPFILPLEDGSLAAYATNRAGPEGAPLHVAHSTSADGLHWTAPVDAMPSPPPWARAGRPDIWAPEVMRIGTRYVLYFTARHATRQRPDGLTLCLGAATSDTPQGPFVPQPEPLTCGGTYGVIDASPYRDTDAAGHARLWLIYKTDGNCCGVTTRFLVQRLAGDGLSLAGQPQALAGIANDAPWEGHVIEAPQFVLHAGQLYLFYAGNDYGSGAYATGYARCDGPLGPCHDAPENPILSSRPGPPALVGPGHQSVFHAHGRDWIAFHGWRPAGPGGSRYRALYILPLDWTYGRPVVGP